MEITRKLVVLIVLIAVISFVLGATTWSAPGTFYTGAAAVWDGSSAFQASGNDTNGLIFALDGNTVCFNGTTCDVNVDWNGTDIIINGPA